MRSKVSVIIPVFNREKTIERAVRSILMQTYQNVEVIVVDDCSTDRTVALVNKIDDERVKCVRLDKNCGACRARNVGIAMATGDFVAFQDSDDEWLPNKLEIQVESLKNDKVEVNFCAFYRINGRKKVRIPERNFVLPKSHEAISRDLLKENFISTQTILARRDVFKKVKFDEDLPRFQDWDLAIRLAREYQISYTDSPLVNVYVQGDSITKNAKKGLDALEIIRKKYSDQIIHDWEVLRSFSYKKCILSYKAGFKVKKEAWEYLQGGFNMKIFYVWLRSMFR